MIVMNMMVVLMNFFMITICKYQIRLVIRLMEVEEFEHPTLQIVQEAQVKKLEGMITIIITTIIIVVIIYENQCWKSELPFDLLCVTYEKFLSGQSTKERNVPRNRRWVLSYYQHHFCLLNGTCGNFWARINFQELTPKITFSLKFAKFRRGFSQNNWSDFVIG